MAGTYTRWYREGTVKVVNGSTALIGTNTYWLTAGLNPGDIFSVDGVNDFEIHAITDNTHITLKTPYTGASNDAATYHIIRNFTAHVPSQLAAQLTDLYGDLARYWNQDMQTIHGKSAYEIAVEQGYTGTESDWIDYISNGGELVNVVEPITYNNAPAHNAICRGKDLGTEITAEQIANIRNKSYKDIYCGDTWTLNLSTYGSTKAVVWGCDIYGGLILGLVNRNFKWCMNDPDEEGNYSWEGHLKGSKIYNETLPALLAEVEAVIPPEYIMTRWDIIGDAVRMIEHPYGHPAYSFGLRSHSVSSTTERIYLASARNVGYDFSAVYDYNWGDTHIDNIQQNVGWLQINNIKFPFFNHKPLKRPDYADGFLGLSMFQHINNYYMIGFANNSWTPIWLPFVILG